MPVPHKGQIIDSKLVGVELEISLDGSHRFSKRTNPSKLPLEIRATDDDKKQLFLNPSKKLLEIYILNISINIRIVCKIGSVYSSSECHPSLNK